MSEKEVNTEAQKRMELSDDANQQQKKNTLFNQAKGDFFLLLQRLYKKRERETLPYRPTRSQGKGTFAVLLKGLQQALY